jgi:YVTN family beta-propeller protein
VSGLLDSTSALPFSALPHAMTGSQSCWARPGRVQPVRSRPRVSGTSGRALTPRPPDPGACAATIRLTAMAFVLMSAGGGCVAGEAVPPVAPAATVQVGQWPEDVLFDPGSNRVFVADEGSATVTVLGPGGEPLGRLGLATRARHLAVDAVLGRLYAPNEGSGFVAVFDTRELTEHGRVQVGRQPHGIAADPASHRVFVGNEGDGSLTAFDGRTGTVLFTVPVGRGPGGVAVDPVSGRVFVVSVKEDRVVVVDGERGVVRDQLTVGRGPTHLAINPETGVTYVLNTEAASVTLLDGRASRVLATVPVGTYPIGVAVDVLRRRAYVVNNRASTLSIVDEATLNVTNTWAIPKNVSSIAFAPVVSRLYLALKGDNRVVVVRADGL